MLWSTTTNGKGVFFPLQKEWTFQKERNEASQEDQAQCKKGGKALNIGH